MKEQIECQVYWAAELQCYDQGAIKVYNGSLIPCPQISSQ